MNMNFNVDTVRLKSLGFTDAEIYNFQNVLMYSGKFSTTALTQFGYNYEQCERLRYMYNICAGKVLIDTPDELSKHLRKMFGSRSRIGIQNLEVSKIKEVPRFAVVGNIRIEPFTIWNSNQYPINKRFYQVVDVSSSRITIKTGKIPAIKYGGQKAIDGVLEIKEITPDKKVEVAFDKKYCKLCNRFIIVASLRRPEFHHGMYEMICFEGTRVYVYAQTLGVTNTVKYNMGTQRIYDYGLIPNEIDIKLKNCASHMYKLLHGAYVAKEPGNQDYLIMPIDNKQEEEEEIEE